jgi:histidine triad (HIT) family protein
MATCPFCQIAKAGLPPHGVYEDASFFIMLDRESLGFGHCMVIPKRHVVKVYDLNAHETSAFFALAQQFAIQLEHVLAVKAVGYIAFGSGLPHAHLHLVPHNDSRVLVYPHDYARALSEEELQAQAERLRTLLPAQW